MDEIILLLLGKGAHLRPIRITTTEIGKIAGMSQQNASLRLRALEAASLLERKNEGLLLTKKATDSARETYLILKESFDKKPVSISGKILSGLGEGKYYLSIPQYRERIIAQLGFAPYAGTLNVRLNKESAAHKPLLLKGLEPEIISGFERDGRAFGDIFAYPCRIGKINAAEEAPHLASGVPLIRRRIPKLGRCEQFSIQPNLGMKCALIVPMRTHHPPDVVEIIAEFFIKDKMRLRDGDEVKIELD
mgnify:CR=1 FL=1